MWPRFSRWGGAACATGVHSRTPQHRASQNFWNYFSHLFSHLPLQHPVTPTIDTYTVGERRLMAMHPPHRITAAIPATCGAGSIALPVTDPRRCHAR